MLKFGERLTFSKEGGAAHLMQHALSEALVKAGEARMEYKIDAANKIVGRLATNIATLLRGKNSPEFSPAKLTAHRVVVYNTDKVKVSGKKTEQKIYRHHSGFHGGLKEKTFRQLRDQDSRQIIRHAVMGMLPKNRLRAVRIKNLTMRK